MGFLGKIIRVLVVLAVMGIYVSVLWLGMTEESRRSLTITRSSASNADFVIVNVRVTSIDTAQGLLHERIRLVPMGRFAIARPRPPPT